MGERKAPWGRGVSGKHAGCPQLGCGGSGDGSGEGYSLEAEFAPWVKRLPCLGWSLLGQQELRGEGPWWQIRAGVRSGCAHTVCILYVLCKD